nr:MAG TPA: hypothetical protein [Caudoviricetes sp.]
MLTDTLHSLSTHDSNAYAFGSFEEAISRCRSPSVMKRACCTPPPVSRGSVSRPPRSAWSAHRRDSGSRIRWRHRYRRP